MKFRALTSSRICHPPTSTLVSPVSPRRQLPCSLPYKVSHLVKVVAIVVLTDINASQPNLPSIRSDPASLRAKATADLAVAVPEVQAGAGRFEG